MKIFGRDIIRQVARDHGVTFEEIVGRTKRRPVLTARLDAIARLRALNFTVAAIGRLLNRDHSTITYHTRPDYRVRNIARARRWYYTKSVHADRARWNEMARAGA